MTLSTAPKFFCFVLMPFDPSFTDTYQLGIKQACMDAGAYCERVDEQIFEERMLDRIYNQIAKADLIIADMSERNANVFYEVGYAHALDKPTVLLTKSAGDIPFDLKHFAHIVYGNSIVNLRADLLARVKWFMERPRRRTDDEFPVDLFLGNKNIAAGDVTFVNPPRYYPQLKFTVQNRTGKTLSGGEFRIAVVCGNEFPGVRSDDCETTLLPDGKWMHTLPWVKSLFPTECTECSIALYRDELPPLPVGVVVRVFTEAGNRDFPITILEGTESGATNDE